MAGSAADTPTTPEFVRVSDVERDQAVDALKHEFVRGRLSHETFVLRMQAALGARDRGQLSGLFADLPAKGRSGRGRLGRARSAARAAARNWSRNTADALDDGFSALSGLFRDLTTRQPVPEAYPAAPVLSRPAPDAWPAPLVFPRGGGTSFTIGRHQGCDLHIGDMTVSRLHARLARNAGGWLLTDLGSTNGTRLNGWRVREEAVPVRAGDQIRFGSAEFFIVQPDEQPDVHPDDHPDEQPEDWPS
jgi:hypothetical protein